MARRVWTVARIEEIQRLIAGGLSDRQIARTLRCRRSRVREIRGLGKSLGEAFQLAPPPEPSDPPWVLQLEWSSILSEIKRGFEIKRIWEERVGSSVTSYSNFWKYLSKCYAYLLKETVTLREFDPGAYCEVDWAGDTVPWWDSKGQKHEAHVFIGNLCYSQLIFAWAASDERKHHWLLAHQKLYAFLGGVPRVTVPDNLKTGVSKAHLYDPDLNPTYTELARHYQTAIIPARVKRPKDKALVENAVGMVMRLFRWTYRNHRFHSLTEVVEAFNWVCERINAKTHTRFKVSRRQRFESLEKHHLKPLPSTPFEEMEWKAATVHPDCTIVLDSVGYSVPHIHRGKQVRVKLTAHQVEVFVNLERVALHPRHRSHKGVRIIEPSHLPANSQAYREATPQNILCQARFLSPSLHAFLDELFSQDTLVHLRRAQGFIRHAREEVHRFGKEAAEPRIAEAIHQMQRFEKIKVSFFAETLQRLRHQHTQFIRASVREIQRMPGNPMLRGHDHTRAGEPRQLGDQQRSLLPEENQERERNNSHEYDPSQTADAGAKTPRHGFPV